MCPTWCREKTGYKNGWCNRGTEQHWEWKFVIHHFECILLGSLPGVPLINNMGFFCTLVMKLCQGVKSEQTKNNQCHEKNTNRKERSLDVIFCQSSHSWLTMKRRGRCFAKCADFKYNWQDQVLFSKSKIFHMGNMKGHNQSCGHA